jgi:glutaryl-CoA dehydrogenase
MPAASLVGGADSDSFDFLRLDAFYSERHKALQTKLRTFVDNEVLPGINDYWSREEMPLPLFEKLAGYGIAGANIRGHGCPGLDPLATGIIAFELGRGDISLSTMFGVHSGLSMGAIDTFGTESQKQRWLPAWHEWKHSEPSA